MAPGWRCRARGIAFSMSSPAPAASVLSAHEAFIRLTRRKHTVSVAYNALLNHPEENIYVLPADVITVVRDPQTFTAFGATGRSEKVAFDTAGITLEEAIAKAGGLNDSRADPGGIFLLRFEPTALVAAFVPSYVLPPVATWSRSSIASTCAMRIRSSLPAPSRSRTRTFSISRTRRPIRCRNTRIGRADHVTRDFRRRHVWSIQVKRLSAIRVGYPVGRRSTDAGAARSGRG